MKEYFEEFMKALDCLNDLSKEEKGRIKGRILELEFDLIEVIKDNENESTYYPYYSYDLTLTHNGDLVMVISVNGDEDITVSKLADWLLD